MANVYNCRAGKGIEKKHRNNKTVKGQIPIYVDLTSYHDRLITLRYLLSLSLSSLFGSVFY